MRGSVKAWIPASVAVLATSALLVAIVLGTPRESAAPGPSPSPSIDTRSSDAVISAISGHNVPDWAHLLERNSFALDVASQAAGSAAAGSIITYTSPVVRAGILARLAPDAPPPDARGIGAVESPRGTTTYFYARPIVDAEGVMYVDGVAVAPGHSALKSWRLIAGNHDGPPGQDTPDGASGNADMPILQQWNTPDRVGTGGPQPYLVEVEFTIGTTFLDGSKPSISYTGTIAVTVGFAASSG